MGVATMNHSGAKISRSGDFDDNANYNDTTDYFTPCACTWGNNNNTVKLLEQSSGLNDTLFFTHNFKIAWCR